MVKCFGWWVKLLPIYTVRNVLKTGGENWRLVDIVGLNSHKKMKPTCYAKFNSLQPFTLKHAKICQKLKAASLSELGNVFLLNKTIPNSITPGLIEHGRQFIHIKILMHIFYLSVAGIQDEFSFQHPDCCPRTVDASQRWVWG